jgi:hypothetical protein
MIQLPYTVLPSKAPQHTVGVRSGKKDSQTRMDRSVATLGGDDSAFLDDTTVFDRYFSRPAALARHKSAPLLRERERFLAHLEATGTRRSAIRIAATYLLQVLNILGLRRLRDVTLDEVDRAADHWNTSRNQDKQYPAGQFGVRCFAQTARRFLRFEGKLKYPRLPQPFSKYLEEFVEAMSSERGLSEATIRGRRYRAADFLKWYARRHRSLRRIRLLDIDAYETVGARLKTEVDGVVISSRDVPSTGAPRYATEYTLRGPDGRETIYVAGATDASLPRSLPVGTTLKKERWHLDYEKNGERVEDFGVFFYASIIGIALACVVWSFVLWRRQIG